jgi:hypothetical protein
MGGRGIVSWVDAMETFRPNHRDAVRASTLVGGDGMSIVAVPALERVTAELADCNFDVEVLASTHHSLKHTFLIAAIRRCERDGAEHLE